MSTNDFTFAGNNSVSITLNNTQINARALPDGIRLYLRANLEFRHPGHFSERAFDYVYTVLTGEAQYLDQKGHPCPLTPIDTVQINRFLSHTLTHSQMSQCNIAFPISYAALEKLDQIRSKDVVLRFELDLGVMLFGPPHLSTKLPEEPPRVSEIETTKCHYHNFIIPRDVWIEQVLSKTDKGLVYISEFPLGKIDKYPSFKNSIAALRKAERFFRGGEYDNAVGECRIALEPAFEQVENEKGQKIPILKEKWVTSLGVETYTWLNKVLGSIKTRSNKPHHSPNRHFDRFEAQMLISITTVCLSYLARSLEE